MKKVEVESASMLHVKNAPALNAGSMPILFKIIGKIVPVIAL